MLDKAKIDYYIEIPFAEIKKVEVKKGMLWWKKTEIYYNHTTRQLPFYFDAYWWLHFCEQEQISPLEFGKYNDQEFIYLAYYYAMVSAYKDIGIKIDFSKDDVRDWFKKMPQGDAQSIFECMLKSEVGGESLVDLIVKQLKKKKKQ